MSTTSDANGNRKSQIREYAEAILIALVLALFIRTFIVQAFKIPSGSMLDTLLIGDHILVSKFSYGIKNPLSGSVLVPVGEPARYDIVVFKYPENPSQDFIKRVIGLPGDTIKIVDKKVYVNDEPLPDDPGQNKDPIVRNDDRRDNFGPVKVPPHALFVMGDNRDNSHDSRFWGFVDYKEIRGKAFVIYWSWNRQDFSVRWRRIGRVIA